MKLKDVLFVIIIIGLISIPITLNLFGDWFWFLGLKYESVFLTILFTSVMIGLVAGVAFFLFASLNVKLAKRISLKKVHKKTDIDKFLIVLAGVFALMIGFGFSNWGVVLKFLNPSQFASVDPVFSLNIAFYAFALPFYHFLFNFLLLTLALTTLLTFLAYLFYSKSIVKEVTEGAYGPTVSYSLEWSNIKAKIVPHVSVLLACLFFVLAFGLVLYEYELLFSTTGAVYGAGYTDLNVILPLLMILSFVSVGVGILCLSNLKLKRWKLPAQGAVVFVVIAVIGFLITAVVQALVVAPNEFNLESVYIKRNIENTLDAYNLDQVEEQIFLVSYNLTIQDIQKNNATINNIRLWDYRPLMQTYNQLQLFRTYYDFHDVDIDRYQLDNQYKQVLISAREMNPEKLQVRAKTWVNTHLVYTHGYGAVMNPVDKISQEGLPEFYVKDIPPTSQYLDLKRPEIYYGEETNEYVIIKTTTEEFDYPLGEQNIYTSYEGKGGVVLSDMFKRLVYAVKFGSIELLVSGSLKPDSRILMYRNIRERVSKIAPFLLYDSDPYIVISDEKLYYIIDAYTHTSMYPYSEPIYTRNRLKFNYIRNSVKVLVDAYNGDVKYYVIDQTDPLIQTYRKIFPDLFLDFSEMSSDLKKHIRYPVDFFSIQAGLYAFYHMKDPMVFYNKEDVWVIPDEIYRGTRQRMVPYYIIMRLPEKEKEEFILMIPFVPRGKENMIGWMAAMSDFPDYGGVTVFQFSKQVLTYGPMQIEARIDQDTWISQKITLWSQSGSSVIRGNTLVIPIEDSVLYIEPLYLEAIEKGALPQLKRVIVAYGDRLTMQESLQDALSVIFGEAPVPTVPGEPEEVEIKTPGQVLAQISDLYEKAQQALREGNLIQYASYIDAIGALLETFGK